MTWQAIIGVLGWSYPALLRQFEAGGPVFTACAAQSPDTRNYHGQIPLRRTWSPTEGGPPRACPV